MTYGKKEKKGMDIAYSCDDNYMEQTIVSITSLLINNNMEEQITIWFIDMGISDTSKEILNKTVARFNRTIQYVKFEELAYDLELGETGRHIASVYAKLFFSRLPWYVKRMLYLDSDTVITDSISDLWNMNLDGFAVAGVETLHTKKDNQRMELPDKARAINDGVILMNIEYWRKYDLTEKCKAFIHKYNGCPPVLSEGTINYVCKDKIKIIEPRYNLMSALVNQKAKKLERFTERPYYDEQCLSNANSHPIIIHYLSAFYNRPWCKRCSHPLKQYYLEYREFTPYAKTELSEKKLPVRLELIGILYKYLPISAFVRIRKLVNKSI